MGGCIVVAICMVNVVTMVDLYDSASLQPKDPRLFGWDGIKSKEGH